MNSLRLQFFRQQEHYLRILSSMLTGNHLLPMFSYISTVETLNPYHEISQKHNLNDKLNLSLVNMQRFSEPDKSITDLSIEEIEETLQQLVKKNKDKHVEKMLLDCLNTKKLITDKCLKFLLKHYATSGKPEMIITIQKYCAKLLPNVNKRNGEFLHYLAKAQCMKGNSDKGLSLMKECYMKYQNMNGFHRILFRELIVDTVMNRSEASLVVFKKFVLEFSKECEEHYPLVCLWHVCWLSSWYSDQLLANELWDTSEDLRKLICEKVTPLSISALKSEYNDDAVVRLLQTLLKYKKMSEYTSVLQVLFNYKLKNRDLRGCTEILRNCEVLGITLPSNQQGRYIKMLISGKSSDTKPQTKSKEFKLKF